ncbi:MAG: presenilin family intramembrane aspartyl protease [Candidatus Paceibacterales bacterium]
MSENNQIQAKKVKRASFGQFWRIFAIEAFLFFLTFSLGIAAAFRINRIFKVQKTEIPQISFWKFIFYFFFATLFIFLIVRFVKFKKQKGIIFKILFVLAVFWGGVLLLNVWIPGIISLILITVLILWWWRLPSVFIQDLCIVLGIAGVGSVLGLSLTPGIIIPLLIFFSIYDFIAVYKTKHMVEMAKEMIKSRAILALVIPPDIFGFRKNLGGVKPGGKFLVLGGGDIVFPLLLSVSLIPFGILNSLIVAFFSLIGLFVGFWFFVSQKTRQPIPALPPIALFSIIGYLITKIFY